MKKQQKKPTLKRRSSKKITTLKGGLLKPPIGVADRFAREILTAFNELHGEIKAVIGRMVAQGRSADEVIAALDVLQAQIDKGTIIPRFSNKHVNAISDDMAHNVEISSTIILNAAVKKMGEHLTMNRLGVITPRVQEIINASANEAASLIKLLPRQYISEVSGAVSRSIATGEYTLDTLTRLYNGRKKWARNVAYDQTRKTFANINAQRMKDAGIDEFEWVHIGGSLHPRKLHVEMSGNIYKLSDPPYIGDMYGQRIHGKPGDLPNCACQMRLRKTVIEERNAT